MGARVSLERLRQGERRRDQVQRVVQRAQVAIVSAKYAYASQSDNWLSLWSRAVAGIERCPQGVQPKLKARLEAILELGSE